MTSKQDTFWIRHLLRRAGFGYSPEELAYYEKLGYEGTLDELLHPDPSRNRDLDDFVKGEFDFTTLRGLQRWWIYRMAYSKCPLEEKMTLFWHGHFATSDKKVQAPYPMYLQNQMFRKLALGNFHELLYSVSKDPAMIIWLDNQQNRKGKPNENYAREIMELFSMGIGNYSENDIKEASRAFTGWNETPSGFVFRRMQHDFGSKTFLGESGDWNGDDVVRIIVKQVSTGRFLARKLCTFFVSEEPSDALVSRIASVYQSGGFSIRKMLRAIFTDDEFLSRTAYHAKVKSPCELVVGAIKTLQVKQLDQSYAMMMERMGQSLFQPPNVKGWDGGAAWIAADKMMERFNFAQMIVTRRFSEMERYELPSQIALSQGNNSTGELVSYLLDLLVDADVPAQVRQRLMAYYTSDVPLETAMMDQPAVPLGRVQPTFNRSFNSYSPREQNLDVKLRGLVHLIMTLPTYHLC